MAGLRRFFQLRVGPVPAALAAAGLAAAFLVSAWHAPFIDFHVYHLGGRTLTEGGPVYQVTYRTSDGLRLPFTYTPFAAILMAPLALLGFKPALVVWTIASVVAWGLTVWSTAPRLRHPAAYALVMVATVWWFMPLVRDLKLGQINTFLVLMVLVDLGTVRLKGARGVLTGIAAGIKLTPLVFLPWLVLTRQWRAAAAMAGGFAATVALGALVLPRPAWSYWTDYAWASERVGDPTYVSNQSINGLLARFDLTGHALTLSWLALAGLIGLACLILATLQHRQGEERLAVGTMALASLFCSPISWSHHWVWILPIVGIALEVRRWRDPVGYAVIALYFWAPIWNVPREHHRELHWTPWQHVLGESYLIGGVLTLLWLVAITVGTRRASPTPASAGTGLLPGPATPRR